MSRFKRVWLVLLAVTLLPIFSLSATAEGAPATSAKCACLYLPHNKSVLYGKNENQRHPMASTTKIMTALVAIENASLTDEFCVPSAAVGIEGSSIYLKAGERQTMESLLYAMLLESANDAAAAIAIHVGGSIHGFADMMNEKAAALGLLDTHFTNPHGLAEDGHYTTALELAKIAAAAMENECFRQIVSTRKKTITVADGEGVRVLVNHNKLLRAYPDCTGVKTGFTKKSGRCLVSAAEREGLRLIAVTLGAPDDWRDHTEMLDFGFSLYEGRIPLSSYTCRIPVLLGKSDHITLSPSNTPSFVVKRGDGAIEVRAECNRYAIAPIKKGDRLGRLLYLQNGKVIAEEPLLAEEDVTALPVRLSLWDRIKKLLNM